MSRLFICFLLVISFTGCLTEPVTQSSTSAPDFFSGADSAVNLGGAIRIQWTLPNQMVQGFNIYSVDAQGQKVLIGKTDGSRNLFTHLSVSPSVIYSYIVKAITTSGQEDGNEKIVRSFIYPGILSVAITGATTAQVSIASDLGAFDSLRIYATPVSGTKKLAAEVSAGNFYADISGLRSGTQYTFSVQAFNSALQVEDGNTIVATGTTLSNSFSTTDLRYQGLINVQAYGSSAGPASGTPKVRTVILQYNPFRLSNGQTKYKIIRVLKDNTPDMLSTVPCTSTTDTSCIPISNSILCDNFTLPSQCTDTAVGASPKKYDYLISQYFLDGATAYIEQAPANTTFKVTVAIPPNNMVLVKREAVNYEICTLMGRTPDPLNNMRCAYTGYGAKPVDKGIVTAANPALDSLSTVHYDFGYDIFVDRYEAGCNWNLKGAGVPNSGLGSNGDVYYRTDPVGNVPSCFIKNGGNWAGSGNGLSGIALRNIYTIDPSKNGAQIPPLDTISQDRSDLICRAQSDTHYGVKRLPRLREFRAYAAWPAIGEVGYSVNTQLIESSVSGAATAHTENFYCNSNMAAGFTVDSSGLSFGGLGNKLNNNKPVFLIGSLETKKCVSRYGVQDHIGNFPEYVSDTLMCDSYSNLSTNTSICTGTAASFDSGNTDLLSFNFDDTPTGGPIQIWLNNGETISSPRNYTQMRVFGNNWGMPNIGVHSYFSVPLGLPMMGDNNGNALYASSFLSGDSYSLVSNGYFANHTLRSPLVGGFYQGRGGSGRWNTDFTIGKGGADQNTGFRCVLPIP